MNSWGARIIGGFCSAHKGYCIYPARERERERDSSLSVLRDDLRFLFTGDLNKNKTGVPTWRGPVAPRRKDYTWAAAVRCMFPAAAAAATAAVTLQRRPRARGVIGRVPSTSSARSLGGTVVPRQAA